MLTPRESRPQPEKEYFPRPPKREDGSYIYDRVPDYRIPDIYLQKVPISNVSKIGLGQFRFLGIFKRQYTTDSDSPHFRESTQPYFASGGDARRGPSRAPSGMTSTARTSARWRIAETPLQIGCWLRRRLLCDSYDSSLYLLCTEMSAEFLRLSSLACLPHYCR